MKKFIKNIKKYYKYAIRQAKAELKSEVADSYLNYLWWVVEPLCFMIIYVFVFGYIFNNEQPYFSSYVFIGLTAWEFFNRMVSGSVNLIINNRDLISKVYLPKYILLLSKSFIYLFKLFISLGIAFVLMIFEGVPLSWYIVFLVLVIPVLYIVSFGIGMILMNFGVILNDLNKLTNIALKMIFYLSGVFYNIRRRLSGNLLFFLLRANPVAFCMDELRKCLLESKMPSITGLTFWLMSGLILCLIGIKLIHNNENSYAKVI